jgi:CYTH domain-containing protein
VAIECERKFLVRDDGWRPGARAIPIRQGYLADTERAALRVRIAGDDAYITIKERKAGPARREYEYSIPRADADEIIADLCVLPIVEKVRHVVDHRGCTWVVDVFAGENSGLVLAEVELPSPDHPVELPSWVGEEVTGDARYHNVNLAQQPFRSWANR